MMKQDKRDWVGVSAYLVCVPVCLSVHGGQRSTSDINPQEPFPFFFLFETESPTGLGLASRLG